jgi:hypothetical protein
MASTRTPSRKRAASQLAARQTPTTELTALARDAARIQIAACATAATTLAQWAEAADRFAQEIAGDLLRRVDGDDDSTPLVARVTEASGKYLRELTALPRAAADQFDMHLARQSTDHKEAR